MARYTPLSLTAQTVYAQMFDAALGADTARTVANLRGSFAKKIVKGRDYWYFLVRCSAIECGSLSQPASTSLGTTCLRQVSASVSSGMSGF